MSVRQRIIGWSVFIGELVFVIGGAYLVLRYVS